MVEVEVISMEIKEDHLGDHRSRFIHLLNCCLFSSPPHFRNLRDCRLDRKRHYLCCFEYLRKNLGWNVQKVGYVIDCNIQKNKETGS